MRKLGIETESDIKAWSVVVASFAVATGFALIVAG